MSVEKATVHSKAPSLTAKTKGETIKRQTKGIPTKLWNKRNNIKLVELNFTTLLMPSYCFHNSFLQFTVLDKDALSELVSFLEDLLIVDVGHGWDEALEEEQDVAHTQRSKLPQYAGFPNLPGQGQFPRFIGTVVGKRQEQENNNRE